MIAERPICPGCGCEGIHASADECLAVLRGSVQTLTPVPPAVPAPAKRYWAVPADKPAPVVAPPPPHLDREYGLTINEAAEAVHVHRRTIHKWITGGKIDYRRTAGGAIRIRAASLWLNEPCP